MTERLTRSCGGRKKLLAFCAVFSYGVLYGLERGNILLLCWPLMAFFILYRNSENPLLRELACLALAIAAGFKLYPAFLGVLLLRDKNYLAAVRTVLYGIVCLCFPLFLFNEGLFGLTLWFRVLFDFSGSRGEPWIGNGFSNILAEAGHAVDKLLGTSTKKQEAAIDTTPRVADKDVAAERKKDAVKKTLDAVGKTPPSTTKVGMDSDKAGGSLTAKDVMKLSQDDFKKLPDDVLARMRGDEL